MSKLTPPNLSGYMARLSAAVITLMPLHAFMTVWASSLVGYYTAIRLWKEAVLLVLLLAAGYLYMTQSKLRKAVQKEPLIGLIAVYGGVLLLVGAAAFLFGTVSGKALAYGILIDGRFLAFFGVTWVVTVYSDFLVRYWKRLLLIPASVVVGFGVLQATVLPADFLRHFGYGPDTIPPSATVDQKASYQRIQSTLRGANPLGAYLIVVLSALGALLIKGRKLDLRYTTGFILSGLALLFTFSRSAWLGVVASMACLIWMSLPTRKARRGLILAGCVALLAFGATLFILRNNDTFQNVFFHTNENSRSAASSNEGHLNAIREGAVDILQEPWGRGPGTAGPASVYNHGYTRIAENYYVQVGQEVGLIGLGLFVAINVLVVLRLWKRRGNTLAVVLLVSFAGITVVNMLMHGWADDTLAYVWWGLAGAAVATPEDTTHAYAD
jgi:hypothetical protein